MLPIVDLLPQSANIIYYLTVATNTLDGVATPDFTIGHHPILIPCSVFIVV
jgi:hypothetical protein